jgi:hypothetical protein
MDCRTAVNGSDEAGVRAWLFAALRPFRVDVKYFDDLGESLDRFAPTVEC